jgi:hypothetical protein
MNLQKNGRYKINADKHSEMEAHTINASSTVWLKINMTFGGYSRPIQYQTQRMIWGQTIRELLPLTFRR